MCGAEGFEGVSEYNSELAIRMARYTEAIEANDQPAAMNELNQLLDWFQFIVTLARWCSAHPATNRPDIEQRLGDAIERSRKYTDVNDGIVPLLLASNITNNDDADIARVIVTRIEKGEKHE